MAKAEADRLEQERVATAAKAEAERLEQERVAADARAAAETERLEKERAAAEAERAAKRETLIVADLGTNWRERMREAIDKGFLTGSNKTEGETLLGDGVFDQQLKTLSGAGVRELKTFWSKIPSDTPTSIQSVKFVDIVQDVAAKLDKFMETKGSNRDAFISKIKAEFKIDKLTDGGRLLQFEQKDNDCLKYWLEISKDDPDNETIFAMFKPEYYADFKKHVLKNVYGFEDSQASKLLRIFSNFVVLCHMLEYMSANPEDVDKKYINMFQKMNLSEGKVKILETDTTKSVVTMFSLFKQLLARGIAQDDMQIIDGTNHAGSEDFVGIVLISFMYLVFSKPVFTEYPSWLSKSYKAYSYTDFLNGLQPELLKISSNSYIKAATNLISKCYYKDKDNTGYTLVSETNETIKLIISLTKDIDVVDTVLLELASLEGLNKIVNNEVSQRLNKGGKRIDGKRIGGKRIDGKKFTHKIIKKSPLNKRNAKTTKKNKHFSAGASNRASSSNRTSASDSTSSSASRR